MNQPWLPAEIKQLKELRLDPVRNNRKKILDLVRHFKGERPSVWGVTEGKVEPRISKALARKVRDLTAAGKLDWVTEGANPAFRRRNLHLPTNPLQEEAEIMCQQQDHSWMLSIDGSKYEGQAFSSNIRLESPEETEADPPDDPRRPINRTTRTCYFCGYTEFLRGWSVI